MRVLVTGATGFLGRSVVAALSAADLAVVRALRAPAPAIAGVADRVVGDLAAQPDWAGALRDVDAVVHLAAKAHARADAAVRPLNVDAVATLAAASRAAGVGRFVFASSVKAVGEETVGAPLTEASPPAPEDAYGRAKHAAETALGDVFDGSAARWIALRFPLIIGAPPTGNVAALIRLRRKGRPLPVPRRANRRSVLAASDAAAAIAAALRSDDRGPFFVADPAPISTRALVDAVDAGVGRRGPLIVLPDGVARVARRVPRVGGVIRRLCGDLEVDPSAFIAATGWRPATDPLGVLREAASA